MQTHLDSLLLDPIPCCLASQLRCPVLTAPILGSTPTLFCSPLCCPTPAVLVRVPRQLLPAPLSSQLSFASPYHFRIRRDFRSKNPLSGFAPKQTKESLLWRATHIVLHTFPSYPCHLFTINYNTIQQQAKKTKTFTGSNNRNYNILKGFGRPLKK